MPTSRASPRTATTRAAQASRATPIPTPSQASVPRSIESTRGTRANAAAKPRFRATPSQETRERGPKHGQGEPARPRKIAPAVTAAKRSMRAEAA
jgi:hypothetical protein